MIATSNDLKGNLLEDLYLGKHCFLSIFDMACMAQMTENKIILSACVHMFTGSLLI